MTPTKLLIGQILIAFAIVIAGLWTATQWALATLPIILSSAGHWPSLAATSSLATIAVGTGAAVPMLQDLVLAPYQEERS